MKLREWFALWRAGKALQGDDPEPGPDLGIRLRDVPALKRLGDWLHNPAKYTEKWRRRRRRKGGSMAMGRPGGTGAARRPNFPAGNRTTGSGGAGKVAATSAGSATSLGAIIIWARTTFGDSLPWPVEADAGLGVGLTAVANWAAYMFFRWRKRRPR